MTRWVWRQTDSADASLRRSGCGPYAMLAALVRASDGAWRPSGRDGTLSARVRVERSGVTDAGFRARGLTPTELFRSLEAVVGDDVRMPLRARQMRGVDVRGRLLPLLADSGACAVVAVRYGAVQDAGLGVGAFRLGHWAMCDQPDGGTVRVADPLRRQVVRWPVDVLERAMGSFGTNPWGHGRGEAVVVYPWRTWREGYDDCRRAAA